MKIISQLFMVIGFFALLGCEKFLDEKSNKKLVIPSTLVDLQSLLDNVSNVNTSDIADGEIASDDYYLMDDTWVTLSNEEDRRAYIWEPDHSTLHTSWNVAYRQVYHANIVLEAVLKIERTLFNQQDWDNIKGQALILRAKNFLQIASVWSLAYDDVTAMTDLGIPLRLSPDFNVRSERASLEETYNRIIEDFKAAIDLLPNRSEVLTRPSRPAAMALLARTYLFMRDYENCLGYATACLEINSGLLDYNSLNVSSAFPFPLPLPASEVNKEVLYFSHMSGRPPLSINNARVDTNLFLAYDDTDLRKTLFFRSNVDGTNSFRGSYANSSSFFSGISTNEVFLMRAECLARQGEVELPMADLNRLRMHRYVHISYNPLTAESPEEALQYILKERRKELLFRGIRFPDVKRLNKGGADISFKRMLDGVEYLLPPNDLRFALSIPETVIERAPQIKQNLR